MKPQYFAFNDGILLTLRERKVSIKQALSFALKIFSIVCLDISLAAVSKKNTEIRFAILCFNDGILLTLRERKVSIKQALSFALNNRKNFNILIFLKIKLLDLILDVECQPTMLSILK